MIGRRRVGSAGFLAGIVILCVLGAVTSTVRASVEDAGTYGAAFLRVPVGAAGMSVPDIVAGMDPDASLVFSNPAVLGDLRSPQLFLTRAGWLEDLTLNAASFGTPIQRLGLVWSLGSRLLQSGDIQGYDAGENVVETDSYYGLSFSTAVSRRFSRTGIALGAGLTYSREHLPGETGDGVSFSLGASYARAGHRFDVCAENIGGTLSFAGREYPIESRYLVGYGYSIFGGPGRFDLGTQIVMSNSEIRQVEFGGAYRFNRFMTVRAGYNHAMSGATQNGMPLSGGLGFHHGNFSFDYAYTAQEYFSGTHTFSMGFLFGGLGTGRSDETRPEAAAPTSPAVGSIAARPTNEVSQSATPPSPQVVRAGATPVAAPKTAPTMSYVLLGGVHARLESAESEVRALRLLKVDATVEKAGNQYRVVVAKFGTKEEAESALASYENRGHKFRVLAQRD